MQKISIVTIISMNYVSYAKVLYDSIIQYNGNEIDFHVLIVDKKNLDTYEIIKMNFENFTFAEDLSIDDGERLFYKYDIVELNTALKPTFIKYIFKQGYENIIYLDPDIQVFSKINPILDALQKNDIVLTPHSLKPIMDGHRPSEIDFLRTGLFNLGFIALRASCNSLEMLDWWESRCLNLGFNDTSYGLFVDQKWIDLVPVFFNSVYILKHPGCNVAYWNLHERKILLDYKKDLLVNDEHLIFFHFSGVLPTNPNSLSKHQDRHILDSESIVHELVSNYCGLLFKMEYDKYINLPYGFGRLSDGTNITKLMRRSLLSVTYKENSPFSSNSNFQKTLKKHGIASKRYDVTKKLYDFNSLNFNNDDFRIKFINFVIVLIKKLFGVERTEALLKYCAILNRESHLASVLLREKINLKHNVDSNVNSNTLE
jgi:hypothetical protein